MEKIARICWNTHDWKRPSGSEGKSLSDGSYEKKIGFGHEEWILDDSRIYEPNGYHYGFLQPMNVASGKHIGAVYDPSFLYLAFEAEGICWLSSSCCWCLA